MLASGAARMAWSYSTGAAFTRLVVNNPAAAQGRSLAINARSRRPSCFSPHATPAARKPSGKGYGSDTDRFLFVDGINQRNFVTRVAERAGRAIAPDLFREVGNEIAPEAKLFKQRGGACQHQHALDPALFSQRQRLADQRAGDALAAIGGMYGQ